MSKFSEDYQIKGSRHFKKSSIHIYIPSIKLSKKEAKKWTFILLFYQQEELVVAIKELKVR